MIILTRYNSNYYQKYLKIIPDIEWKFIEETDKDYDLIICTSQDTLSKAPGKKIIVVEMGHENDESVELFDNIVFESRFHNTNVNRATVIYPWVDAENLPTWQGNEKRIISISENLTEADFKKHTSYETKLIKNKHLTDLNIEEISESSFYLNLELSYNILIPMAIGVPIVSTPNDLVDEFACNKYRELSSESIESMFKNPFQMKLDGLKNRFLTKSFFTKENFIYRWKSVIQKVIND